MEWFEGGITDALARARDDDKLITVYIFGDNPQSEQVTSALGSELLASLNPRVISLKLKQPSPELTQFAQVFPVLMVPSIYLICPHSGVVFEVLAGSQQTETILNKITEVLSSRPPKPSQDEAAPVAGPATVPAADAAAGPAATLATVPAADPAADPAAAPAATPAAPPGAAAAAAAPAAEPGPSPVVSAAAETSAEVEEPLVATSAEAEAKTPVPKETVVDDVSGGDSGRVSIDDKVQRAERLIELRREEKAQQEADETRRKEIERREALKNVQRIKREREDKEMKELAEQKQKEREEEKRYRAHVQEQIKQDRLERQQRQQQHDENRRKMLQEQQEEADRRKAQNSVSANIMFRLPDGSTVTNLFEADDVFKQVRQHIAEVKNLSSFNLALNFPRRVFDTDCDEKTLRELQLAPSAVLLVIIKTQTGGAKLSGGAQASSRSWWDLLTVPFSVVMSFFTSLVAVVFPPAPIAATEANPNRDAPSTSRKRNQTSGVRQRTPYQRNGNITKLNTSDESDNETNTWNGNSTQQM